MYQIRAILALKERYDVCIIGAGVLGVTIAFWLSCLSHASVALLDKEGRVAAHTSSRNTGVVHRPFYLNPEKKKIFAGAAQKSYFLWEKLAKRFSLSWVQVGTLEVAEQDSQVENLLEYREWALQNGLDQEEVEVLDPAGVTKIEPLVKCSGAIFSKRDTAVDYGELTGCVSDLARKNEVEFLSGYNVTRIEETSQGVSLVVRTSSNTPARISSGFLVNTAGGNAMDLAHSIGLAEQYTDMHFRGEYWIVEPSFGAKVQRNIYSVARHSEFPFLDPHFIVRASGKREVGPNAVLVSGPNAYKGLSGSRSEFLKKIFERPNYPKLRLFTNPQFLSLVWQEWRSSVSKGEMCKRVEKFIPSLNVKQLRERGLSGVRSSVIDRAGFVPEAVIIEGRSSLHVLNYNSPGATGAPAYSAHIVKRILEGGYLRQNAEKGSSVAENIGWNFEGAADL